VLTGEPCRLENYSLELDKHFQVVAFRPQPGQFVCIVEDITPRKRAEAATQKISGRFQNLFESMVQGVVYHDASGRVIAANHAAERILGKTLDQMRGEAPADPRWRAVHEDGRPFPADTHPAIVAIWSGKEVNDVIMGVFNPVLDAFRWIKVGAIPRLRPGESVPYEAFATFERYYRAEADTGRTQGT